MGTLTFFQRRAQRAPTKVSEGCVMILTTVRLLLASFLLAVPALAQQTPTNFAGEYAGMAGPYHVKLHLVTASGSISGTVDSPDAGLFGLQCADFHINGQALSFSVPNVHGSWIGTMSPDGNTLSGMWTQGAPTALNFARVGSPAAAPATTAVPTTPPQPASLSPLPPQQTVPQTQWATTGTGLAGSR